MNYKKELEKYGLSKDDFVYKKVLVHSDTTNSYYDKVQYERVLVPKEIAEEVKEVTVDFTMTNIRFYDKNRNLLLKTVGTGYDDLTTPKAFLISEKVSIEEAEVQNSEEVDWVEIEGVFKKYGYGYVFQQIRMAMMFRIEKEPELRVQINKELEDVLSFYQSVNKSEFTIEDIEFDLMFPF